MVDVPPTTFHFPLSHLNSHFPLPNNLNPTVQSIFICEHIIYANIVIKSNIV